MLLHAQLFGSFKLFNTAATGDPITLPSRSAAKTLLAYLLLHRHKTHNRSQLAFLLAPDSSEERARRILESLSDPTTEPDEVSTGKPAVGAWQDPASQ